ncbi:MAG: PQQ-like beta-propeller repeat protein [Planctomycetia bacterium]|nr:PQQ-like beta-propeller repeat protein [Planctomycetia bacterium]
MLRTQVLRGCKPFAFLLLLIVLSTAQADEWPQWLGPQRDGVWRETGILEKFPEGGPKVRWKTPIGAGYAGPAVVGDKVFITDRILDEGAKNPQSGFAKNVVNGKERILCLDEASGKILWKHEYPATYEISYPSGPRCTPVVKDGKVYTLGAVGDLFCLDAATGKVLWSKNFPKEHEAVMPLWGFAGHPLLDGDQLICLVGGPNALVVAYHKDTGKELWKALNAKEPGYCPPTILTIGGKRQLIIWHPEAVAALDPETGKTLWTHPWNVQAALTVPTPRLDGDRLLLSSFYNGSKLLELKGDAPKVVWESKWAKGGKGETPTKTDNLHAIMPTPFIRDGHIYGICSYGELRCLKLDTGERVWMDLRATGSQKMPTERWGNAFLIEHEGKFFIFNEKGDLIIAKLSPQGYEELSRAHILEPDNRMAGRLVNWSHPAFAHKNMYARNDREIVSVSLSK